MAAGKTEKPPRLADVAEAAGVSQGTASNVFNHPELVREEVRDRVRAAAQKIGYSGPDPKGRILRAGKVNAIGVVTAQPLHCFFAAPYEREILIGISDVCDAHGTGISLVSVADEATLSWNITNALVDGFILICLLGADRLIARSRERQLPFVGLALERGTEIMSVIAADNVDGGRQAARHLVALGHKRFAILSIELNAAAEAGRRTLADVEAASLSEAPDRIRGCFEVFGANGIDIGAVPIHETRVDAETVIAALEELFADPQPPTALICQADKIATIALDWLKANGYAVPGDVSIIGFDGVPEAALTDPPLTTIAQPIREMGRRAAEVVLGADITPVHEVYPVELIVRGSTAPPR